MKTESYRKVLLLIATVLAYCTCVSAQGYKGIIPLESTCEDVKRVLKVENCTFSPLRRDWAKDWISVSFATAKPDKTQKTCYKVPVGKVISISVSYNKPILLSEFEYELKYAEGPFGDIDGYSYENPEKGVSALVHKDMFGNKSIHQAFFGPNVEQHRKFSYKCGTKPKK
jgi:hypothetical protein